MAKVNGKTVQMYVLSSDTSSDVLIAGQIEGSISCSNPIIEDTDKSDTARSILGQAVPAYDVDLTMHFDAADTGQDALRAGISAGSSITLKRFDGGVETDSVVGYVSTWNESLPNNDVVTATATINLTGDASAFL